jgi:enterochelin esterase-like enzyme
MKPTATLALWIALLVIAAACAPDGQSIALLQPFPTATPQVIIVTPEPSATILPTATATPTPLPSFTPTPTATPTPTLPACESAGGQILPFADFRSEIARETLPYRVYLPACYLEYQRRYPVVYLLHGLNQDETEWETIGVIEALEAGMRLRVLGPMILVMPDFGRIGIDNLFPPDPSYESVLLDELLPTIERTFCTIQNPTHRAIGGISRGGFWAYSVGLRHPEIFGVLGGHSASFDADNAPPAFNPLDLALDAPFLNDAGLRMYFDNAAADPAGRELETFSSRLSARGIPHTYVVNPVGGHDDEYWSSHVAEYVRFYGEQWARAANELPSCLEPSP